MCTKQCRAYNIVDNADAAQAMEKLEQFHTTEDQKLEQRASRPN
jgi:hypothetical protein